MIDFNRLRLIAEEIATIGVGDKLPRFDTSGNPAILREYSSVKEPTVYPFVTYDVRHVGGTNQKAINSYIDDLGRSWQEFNENIDIKYCCKGDRSQEIITELYNNLKLTGTRERIKIRMPGLSVQQLMSIKPSPTVNGTQYIEEHSFIVRLTLIHKVHDTFTTQIEGVNVSASISNCITTNDFEFTITPSPTP